MGEVVYVVLERMFGGVSVNIDKIQAGRELDVLVAKKVMGICAHVLHKYLKDNRNNYSDYTVYRCRKCKKQISGLGAFEGKIICPSYSTDIAAAMKIPARMRELGKDLDFARELANILTVNGFFKIPGQIIWNLFYGLEAAPLIICRAALEALEVMGVSLCNVQNVTPK